jgi:hypothetical protein
VEQTTIISPFKQFVDTQLLAVLQAQHFYVAVLVVLLEQEGE